MKRTVILLLAVFSAHALPAFGADRQEIRSAVMGVLDRYMETFNRMDIAAWEGTFHFPHYRLASGGMTVLDGPSGRSGEAVREAIGPEWHHSAWNHRKHIHLSDSKVHVDTRFTRYRKDGSIIASYDSLYVLTNEGGRWGVKLRSSMAP